MAGVILFPLERATLELLARDPETWARHESVALESVSAIVQDVARQTLAFLERTGAAPPWGGYLAADTHSRGVVGTCGYKGAPQDGTVEIAYFTFPEYEGRGYATAMAAALVARAARVSEVHRVRAHTLPERNASVRVLEKLGFSGLGVVHDPEDGPVWRWERPATGA